MNQRTLPSRRLLAVMLLAGSAGSGMAQNALGDGTALDANTGQNGTRNYTRPNFAAELNFRNSIATGNAPGGLSFRGDLGYRAAGEFSGDLGSDALFSFRRDSLYSGLAGMGIRGTDAIQYQFALTTGATLPQNLVGNMSLARDNYYNPNKYQPNYTAGPANRNGLSSTTLGYNSVAAQLDTRGKLLSASTYGIESGATGMLRSSSTYTTTTNLQPSILSVYEQGIDLKPIGLIASPLLGITSTPMAQEEEPNPLVARPANANEDPKASNGLNSTRLTTSYDAIVEQMRQHVEDLRAKPDANASSSIQGDETNDEWLIRQMQDLREKLYGTDPANENTQENDSNPHETNQDPTNRSPENNDPTNPNPAESSQSNTIPGLIENNPNSPLNQAIREKITGETTNQSGFSNGFDPSDPSTMTIDPQTLEVLRATGDERISHFIDPRTIDRNVYAEHITIGEQLLREGRYFDAEERFTHALSIRPRDIAAQLGRFHAQIGAGMVLSASVNLQTLFSTYPEIIASRYTGDLLPSEARIKSLIVRLNERAGIIVPKHSTRASEGTQVRVSAAILLAYLGYQIEDQETVRTGLELVQEIGSDPDRRFASLLEQIWIDHDPVPSDGQESSKSKATQD